MSVPAEADLLLDTDRSAARLGIRSAATAPRQLVFRHAGREIDVLLQSAGDASAVLWGQVATVGGEPCADAEILLENAAGTVDETTTADGFGEFRLAVAEAPPAALRVHVDGHDIRCSFPAPLAATPGTVAGTGDPS